MRVRLLHGLLAACLGASLLAGCGLTPFGSDGVDSVTTGSITPAAVPSPTPSAMPAPTQSAMPAPLPPAGPPLALVAPPPAKPAVVDALADSDWQAIRAVAAGRFRTAPNGAPLDWSNPETGNSGTVAALADPKKSGALSCRAFVLTVSDVRGVRRYQGDACRSGDDSWQLFNMTADDKTLL